MTLQLEQDRSVVLRVLTRECGDRAEAERWLDEMRAEVAQGADPEDLLHDIGLEPDYVFVLL